MAGVSYGGPRACATGFRAVGGGCSGSSQRLNIFLPFPILLFVHASRSTFLESSPISLLLSICVTVFFLFLSL